MCAGFIHAILEELFIESPRLLGTAATTKAAICRIPMHILGAMRDADFLAQPHVQDLRALAVTSVCHWIVRGGTNFDVRACRTRARFWCRGPLLHAVLIWLQHAEIRHQADDGDRQSNFEDCAPIEHASRLRPVGHVGHKNIPVDDRRHHHDDHKQALERQ